jgi:RimJ/RimL family protein N-acetyltransferase
MACVNDDFPSLHYLFLIGGQPVALASLHSYGGSLRDVQVVLAVFGEHQGKGIGFAAAASLKQLAFEVWGFSSLWWIVDVTNKASIKVAEKIGCVWDSSFEERSNGTDSGSGIWHRFVQYRDNKLADGVLQGADIEYWSVPKSSGMLTTVIESRQRDDPST